MREEGNERIRILLTVMFMPDMGDTFDAAALHPRKREIVLDDCVLA